MLSRSGLGQGLQIPDSLGGTGAMAKVTGASNNGNLSLTLIASCRAAAPEARNSEKANASALHLEERDAFLGNWG